MSMRTANEPRPMRTATPVTSPDPGEPRIVPLNEKLERLSQRVTQWAGSTWAFVIAAALICLWALTGPFVGFSPDWQLIVNTGTTIATFLMVFLIQRTQNKESKAVQLKLNELVAAMEGASNRLVGVEELSEAELHRLHDRYLDLASKLHAKGNLTKACSVEETDTHGHGASGARRGAAVGR